MESKKNNHPTVALFITSCARFDLLEPTLKSFFEHNSYQLSQVIVTEDSPYGDKAEALVNSYDWGCETVIIKNGERIGQLASIDKGYAAVKTDYVFHCEDDWLFTRSGFIEDSIKLLVDDSKLFSVWLREKKEYPEDLFSGRYENIGYKVVKDICSFNPSLRRSSDMDCYLPLTQYTNGMEAQISTVLEKQGMYSVLLEDFATDHIGWHRRLDSDAQGTSQWILSLKDKVKWVKSKIYKKLRRGHFKNR